MLRTTVAALRWIAGFLLLAAALNLKDPHLLPVREMETPVILVVCAIGAAATAWQMRRSEVLGRWTHGSYAVQRWLWQA